MEGAAGTTARQHPRQRRLVVLLWHGWERRCRTQRASAVEGREGYSKPESLCPSDAVNALSFPLMAWRRWAQTVSAVYGESLFNNRPITLG